MIKNFFYLLIFSCAILFVISCEEETLEQEPVQLDAPAPRLQNSTSSTFTIEWDEVENASVYVYSLNGTDEESTSNLYVSYLDLLPGEYDFKVKAVASNPTMYLDSDWSEMTVTLAVNKLNTPVLTITNQTAASFTVSWDPVEYAVSYVYSVNDGKEEITEDFSFTREFLPEGEYVIKVKALAVSNDFMDSEWAEEAVILERPIDICTAYIPAGKFMMGTPEGGYTTYPQREVYHEVTLTEDYYMSIYEITTSQFAEFLNAVGVKSDCLYLTEEYGEQRLLAVMDLNYDSDRWSPVEGMESHPIRSVSWYGANEFARWAGGSLPTDAQWEYACRGGQTESKYFGIGDGDKLVSGMAHFNSQWEFDASLGGLYENESGEMFDSTASVGSYMPNGYGLYDMHGNVFEWTADWFIEDLGTDPVVNPIGPDAPPYGDYSTRVTRGGSYITSASGCRSAHRGNLMPNETAYFMGFRIIFPAEYKDE